MFSEAFGPITFFGKIEKVEIVENMLKKKRSTTVIHGGHPHPSSQKTNSTFKTVGTQRVAAVVARSALQSAAPSAARRVVTPPRTSRILVVISSPLKEETFAESL